jgi:hypothetical protein
MRKVLESFSIDENIQEMAGFASPGEALAGSVL